jgi:hypothetical protein
MRNGDELLANLRPAAIAEASAHEPQIVAERECVATLANARAARRRQRRGRLASPEAARHELSPKTRKSGRTNRVVRRHFQIYATQIK